MQGGAVTVACINKATVDLGNGKTLQIDVTRSDPHDAYIESFSLNGKKQERAWFHHSEIAQGGQLKFKMGPHPYEKFASNPEVAPPSLTL